jgi:hypothetical protein
MELFALNVPLDLLEQLALRVQLDMQEQDAQVALLDTTIIPELAVPAQ